MTPPQECLKAFFEPLVGSPQATDDLKRSLAQVVEDAAAAGQIQGPEKLYDVLGDEVYRLTSDITYDQLIAASGIQDTSIWRQWRK